MINDVILKLRKKINLTHDEISQTMTEIFSRDTSDTQNIDFLYALTQKKETDTELLGMLDKMQEFSLALQSKQNMIDMCGTGGDLLQTFNISTSASFVVAAAGGIVAKHGNYSNSGISGSADIFEYFGYDLNQEPSSVKVILEKHNICFMFAQKFHPAMRHVSAARRQLKTRTAFNVLGPITNPARVKNQLVGVSSVDLLERIPKLLQQRGSQNIMTVLSKDGMDEFSATSLNHICMLKNDKITSRVIDPIALGLHKSELKDIQIKTKTDAIKSFITSLDGSANQAMIETVAINAAAGLIVANVAETFEDAINIALETINGGAAFSLLERFVNDTGNISKIREFV